MKRSLVFVFYLVISQLYAQQPQALPDYIERGLSNNLMMKERNLSLEKSLAVLREARGLFMPQVSFEAAYTLADGGRRIAFPVGDLLNPVYNTLNQLTNSDAFPNIANVDEQLLPNKFHDTKIRTVHPLYNAEIHFNHKIRRELVEKEQIEINIFKRQLIKDIKTAWYQYQQAAKAVEVYESAELLVLENYRVSESLVKNNKATREVLYSAESELSNIRYQLTRAKHQQRLAANYLNFLVNQPLETPVPVEASEANGSEVPTGGSYEGREELKNLKNALEINELQESMAQSYRLPKINHVLDIGYQGFGYKFDSQQQYLMYNVSLSWNLFQGQQNRAKVQQAKIERAKLENQYEYVDQQLELQVQNAQLTAQSAQEQLRSADFAVKSAQEYFRLADRRYREGISPQIEFVEARNRLTNSEIQHTVAYYDYLIRLAELEATTAAYPLD